MELPSDGGYDDLSYSELLCGVLEGSLAQIGVKVECVMARDMLKGDEVNEIRVAVKGKIMEDVGDQFKED